MNKRGIAAAVALCLAGAANAQVAPSGPLAGQAPGYAVEGLTLGSKVKSDSAAYREYKCGPSEQFVGFVWCQKTRRESERRGSFEASYSILHAKDGTIVYVNRSQQPAFFDASEADRDIQNYARKFGASPGITRMPRRSGSSDAVLATWGNVELEPLDNDSIKVLAEGKSPKKGFLVDFLSNFTRSAQEGLPIYRIVGGAGFIWAGSYDQKGRGTLRFAAVDASALQPGPVAAQPPAPGVAQPSAPVATQPPAAPQNNDQEPARKAELAAAATKAGRDAEAAAARQQAELSAAIKERREAELAAQAAATKAGKEAEATVARLQSELSTATKERREAELAAQAAATKAGRDAEATVARLQAELSAATKERREAELAAQAAATKAGRDAEATVARLQAELSTAIKGRREAELAAQAARKDAEIARKEFEAATNDANAAKEEIDRLKAGDVAPASNVERVILIGIAAAAILFFLIWAFFRLLSAPPRPSVHAEKTDADKGHREGAAAPMSLGSGRSAEPEARVDTDELVEQLAKTLGVEGAAALSPAVAPLDANGDQGAIEPQEQTHTSTSGGEGSIPPEKPSDGSVSLSSREDDRELARSVVPDGPDARQLEEIKSAPEGQASQPEKAGTS